MSALVIDTNVLLVADGQAKHMTAACEIECLIRLQQIKAGEQVVLDHRRIILAEYGNKLNPSRRPPSPGGAFLKWLLVNQCNPRHTVMVNLTPLDDERTRFSEFPPDTTLEEAFDPSDRKFVCLAYAHPDKPPILESADSKWLGWESALNGHGIRLEVLCRCELEIIWKRKTCSKT
jgi:hypothetical protein